jgi:acylpyruvate hydrolase
MRLATLNRDGVPHAVVIVDDRAVPIDGYRDVGELLRAGAAGREAAQTAATDGEPHPFEDGDLLRPVLHPGAVVCVGLNYRTHILEMGRELPTVPTLFAKLDRALTNPYADVELPRPSDKVDYEGELAVIIGTGGRDIAAEDALAHVAGVTVLNDITARDYQRRTIQWFAGKTFQRSTPVGPWMVTLDEVGALEERELRCSVNGEERQRASLGDLVFDVPSLVADISMIVELEPGDLIATGTPGGVGEPQGRFLADGDVVEVSIDGIGTLRNTFVARARSGVAMRAGVSR